MSIAPWLFPERVGQPQIHRTAEIAEYMRARWFQQQAEQLERGKPREISKLWEDHFRSVKEFDLHLERIGGLENYTSIMENIRWACNMIADETVVPTIKLRQVSIHLK